MRRLRLAYLADPSSAHVQRWLAAFVARGHHVAMLEPAVPGRTITTIPAGVARLRFRPLPTRLEPMGVLAAWSDLRKVIRDWEPDVVHAHYARRPAWHAWLSGFRPYVVTVWGSDVLRAGSMSRIGRLATRLALRDAALVTAGTRRLADAALDLGARPDRLRDAQFGIDTERFRPGASAAALRRKLGIESETVVLSPRILAPLYRHEVVIEALARLPGDVVVLSTAMRADPDERRRLEALAARTGVGDRWRILPAMDAARMADLYRLAEVVVSVPESDAMPQSIMEAMATGRPAVVSDLPDVHDWLGDLTPELIVPVGDVAATADALRTALSWSRDARTSLAARLRQRVVDRADARRSMDLVESLYSELAEAASG